MNKQDEEYLRSIFRDLVNYESDSPLAPIDALTYKTPEGDSCLHIAAARGHLKAVAILLDAGLDPNARGDMGNTPLHYALKGGHNDVAQTLMHQGASTEIENDFGERAAPKN